jgi:hypothetical protein
MKEERVGRTAERSNSCPLRTEDACVDDDLGAIDDDRLRVHLNPLLILLDNVRIIVNRLEIRIK